MIYGGHNGLLMSVRSSVEEEVSTWLVFLPKITITELHFWLYRFLNLEWSYMYEYCRFTRSNEFAFCTKKQQQQETKSQVDELKGCNS